MEKYREVSEAGARAHIVGMVLLADAIGDIVPETEKARPPNRAFSNLCRSAYEATRLSAADLPVRLSLTIS